MKLSVEKCHFDYLLDFGKKRSLARSWESVSSLKTHANASHARNSIRTCGGER